MASIEEFGRFRPPGMVYRTRPFEDDNLDPDENVDREVDEGIDKAAQDRLRAEEEEAAERDARDKNRPGDNGEGKKTNDEYCSDCGGPHDPDAIDHPAPGGQGSGRIVTHQNDDGTATRYFADSQGNADFDRGQVPDDYQGGDGSDPFLEEPDQDLLTGDGTQDAAGPQETGVQNDAGEVVVQGPETASAEGTPDPLTADSVSADTALTLDQVRASQQTAETEVQQANAAVVASDAALESYRKSYVPEWAKAGDAYKADPEAFERHWRTVTERNLEQANTAAERLNAFVEQHGAELDEAKFKEYQQLRTAYEEPLQEIARARGISGYRDGESSDHRGPWGDSQVQLERLQAEHLAPVREAYTAYRTAHGTAQSEHQEAVAAGEAYEGLESRYNTAEQAWVEAANAAAQAEAGTTTESAVTARVPDEGVGYTMSEGPVGPSPTVQPLVAQPPVAGGVDFTTSDDDLVGSPTPEGDTGPHLSARGLQEIDEAQQLVQADMAQPETRSAEELGAGTDTDRPDMRREFDAADPAGPTPTSELEWSDLPGGGVATVQPGVDYRREFDAPSNADTATIAPVSVDTIVTSIESHNQGTLQEQARERSTAAGLKGYADDYETSGDSNALDLIRGNPARGIEPLNADNFRERMAQLPSRLHLGGESMATADLDPSQGHVFTSASPEERAVEQKSLDRRNQARYGQEAEKLRHWAESGYLTVGKTETPDIAVITRPDIQGEVFKNASSQESAVEQKSLERRNTALTRQFEQEVAEAKAQGKVIVLQDPPTTGERLSQAAEVLVPGYGLYKTVQRANHPDSDGGEYVTEREKKAIALEVGMTALDVVPIPVAAAAKPLARLARPLVDAGGNVLSRVARPGTPVADLATTTVRGATPPNQGQVGPVRFIDETSPPLQQPSRYPDLHVVQRQDQGWPTEPAERAVSDEVARSTLQLQSTERTGTVQPYLEMHNTSGLPAAVVHRQTDVRGGASNVGAAEGGAYSWVKNDPDYYAGLERQYDVLSNNPNTRLPGASANAPEGTPAGGGRPVAQVDPGAAHLSEGVAVLERPAAVESMAQPDLASMQRYTVDASGEIRPVRESFAAERFTTRRSADPRYRAAQELEGRIRAEGRQGPVTFTEELYDPAAAGYTRPQGAETATQRLSRLDRQAAVEAQREAAMEAWRAARAGAAPAPLVQTQSGLYVPAAAVSPDLYVAQQQQTVAVPSTSPASDPAAAVRTETEDAVATDQEKTVQDLRQDATRVRDTTAPEEETTSHTGTDPNTGLSGQPELAPTDRTGTDDETTTGTGEETQTGTGHLPDFGYGVVPHDETLPDDQINTGGQPDLETPNLYDAELATARQAQTGSLLDLQDATEATQRTDTHTPVVPVVEEPSVRERPGTVPTPEKPAPKPKGDTVLPVGGTVQRRTTEEETKRPRPRPRVEQPVPEDAHPVEEKRPLQPGEYPRQVVHEEVVLDVPSADGNVDRVLVDVSEPRVTAADRTPPPAGEHVAGNQKITASGQTVYGENVAPTLPPRDAASQNPQGQVEEAVFVTDLDTGEKTVHRYREPRQEGESLEEQLDRVSEEERQVVVDAGPAERSKYERARAVVNAARAAGGATAGTAGRFSQSSLERGRAIAQAAGRQVDEHAPETKAALLERTKRLTGGNKGGQSQPKSLDARLAEVIKGQAAQSGAQKNAPKGGRRRSSSRITDKDLKKLGGRGKVIIIRE